MLKTRQPYSYSGDNGLNFTDPSGADFCSVLSQLVGGCNPQPPTSSSVPAGTEQCNGSSGYSVNGVLRVKRLWFPDSDKV